MSVFHVAIGLTYLMILPMLPDLAANLVISLAPGSALSSSVSAIANQSRRWCSLFVTMFMKFAMIALVPMSLFFQEQLFDFYLLVPCSYLVSLDTSRIVAASLGIYMIMMYVAASLTSSKRRRNGVRAESPDSAIVADNTERGKRGRDAASKSARFCSTCLVPKPPRCHHCSICNSCIDRMDHHCPFINACVGRQNFGYFYLWLATLCVCIAYACYVSFPAYSSCILNSKDEPAHANACAQLEMTAMTFPLACMMGICVGAMFMWMTIMTVLGITTVEAFAYARSSLRLWDFIRRHVTVAFDGQPVMQWLFPWKVIFSRFSGSSQK